MIALASLALTAPAAAAPPANWFRATAPKPQPEPVALPLSPTAWLTHALDAGDRFGLSANSAAGLLDRYLDPSVERPAAWREFWSGRYGPSRWRPDLVLSWSSISCEPESELPSSTRDNEQAANFWGAAGELTLADAGWFPGPALGSFLVPAPAFVDVEKRPACKPWQVVKPVTIGRYGAEYDTLALLQCDGSVAADAIDRLSVLARPPQAPRPTLPLPLEPLDDLGYGEWAPEVKLLHPRLVWVLQRIADAFPGRPIYLVSGYRRDSHGSYHRKGRALDLSVMNVTNEELFHWCRKLKDVGCGYYPNSRFVHVDVRPPATGHPVWIDDSRPGEPSHYVDSWPGVVEGGALSWGEP